MSNDPLKRALGPTGETVRVNLIRLRTERNLGHTELSERLKDAGRHILPLGLRRIENGARRVDVDDLLALAVVLDVSPITLLMPDVTSGSKRVEVTGVVVGAAEVEEKLTAEHLWEWLRCRQLVVTDERGYRTFWSALPAWNQQYYRRLINAQDDDQPRARKAK